ncbi:hypothetical protein J2S21_000845 [Peribacillus cavernae]|nr:hypothetical protein [Peribacillus cavernae]
MLKDKYGIEHSTIQIEHPAIHDHGDYGKQFLLQRSAVDGENGNKGFASG